MTQNSYMVWNHRDKVGGGIECGLLMSSFDTITNHGVKQSVLLIAIYQPLSESKRTWYSMGEHRQVNSLKDLQHSARGLVGL